MVSCSYILKLGQGMEGTGSLVQAGETAIMSEIGANTSFASADPTHVMPL